MQNPHHHHPPMQATGATGAGPPPPFIGIAPHAAHQPSPSGPTATATAGPVQQQFPYAFVAVQPHRAEDPSLNQLSFVPGEHLTATAFNGGWYWGSPAGASVGDFAPRQEGYFHPTHVRPLGPVGRQEASAPPPPPAAVDTPLVAATPTTSSSPRPDTAPSSLSSTAAARLQSALPSPRSKQGGDNKRKRPPSPRRDGDGGKKPQTTTIRHPKWTPPPGAPSPPVHARAHAHAETNKVDAKGTGNAQGKKGRPRSLSPSSYDGSPRKRLRTGVSDSADIDDAAAATAVASKSTRAAAAHVKAEPVDDDRQYASQSVATAAESSPEPSKPRPSTEQTARMDIPDHQAGGARFPPGCPVLYETSSSSGDGKDNSAPAVMTMTGVVRSVHVQLRRGEPAFLDGKLVFDVCYVITDNTSTSSPPNDASARPGPPVLESDLQFATRCPVFVSPSLVPQKPATPGGKGDASACDGDKGDGETDGDEWARGTIASSFKFVGDAEESYVVVLEGGSDGGGSAAGCRLSGVPRDQVRYRPPPTPPTSAPPATEATAAATASASDGANRKEKTSQNTQTQSGLAHQKEVEGLAAIASETSGAPSSPSPKRSLEPDESSKTVVARRITIPDLIDFDLVKAHLVGPHRSVIEKMKTHLRVDIFVIGHDLTPPRDPSVVRDFGDLFPAPGLDGRLSPCVLVRGPRTLVDAAIKVITHLLLEKAYRGSGDCKERVRAELSDSCKDRSHAEAAELELTKLSQPSRSKLATTARRDEGDSTKVVRKELVLPKWLKYNDIGVYLEGRHKQDLESRSGCSIDVLDRNSPILVAVTAPSSDEKHIFGALDFIVDKLLLAVDDEVKGMLIYDAALCNRCERVLKRTQSEKYPILYCRSPLGKEEKVHMVAISFPRGNAGFFIGTGGVHRKRLEKMGCTLEVYECERDPGSYALIFGILSAVEKGRDFVQGKVKELSDRLRFKTSDVPSRIKEIVCENDPLQLRHLRKLYRSKYGTDFDHKSFGFECLSQLVASVPKIKIARSDPEHILILSIDKAASEQLPADKSASDQFLADRIDSIVRNNSPMALSKVKLLYKEEFGADLDHKSFGYIKLKDYVKTIPSVLVQDAGEEGHTVCTVYYCAQPEKPQPEFSDIEDVIRGNEPLALDQLKKAYLAKTGTTLDQKTFGYDNLYDLIASIPAIHIKSEVHSDGRTPRYFLSAKKSNSSQSSTSSFSEVAANIEEIVRENEPLDLNLLKRRYLSKIGSVLDQSFFGYSRLADFIGTIPTIHTKTAPQDGPEGRGHNKHMLSIKRRNTNHT